MRKLVVLTFVSLDGVMQAPGGPDEDSSSFKLGGWSVPYWDDFLGGVMNEQMEKPFDLLLGRKTYEIFNGFWPKQGDEVPGASQLNNARKYVVSTTMKRADWKNSTLIKTNVPQEIRKLKEQDGPMIQVHGSSGLIQTLLKNDLVDEFWLKIYPVTLGKGKRLFGEGSMPGNFKLVESKTSPKGVIVANYARAGDVKTASFGM